MDQTLNTLATKEREETKWTTKKKMTRQQTKERGNRQKTTEDIDGGLHPAVDGQSLGER